MPKPTGPACGNNPNYRMSDGDRQAVEAFQAYLAERAALRDRIAEALDSLQGTAHHLPPETRQRVIEAVTGAVLPAPTDRASVLRDFLFRLEQSAGDAAAEKLLDDNPDLAALLAAGAQQPKEA
jgi:hypothetical protein